MYCESTTSASESPSKRPVDLLLTLSGRLSPMPPQLGTRPFFALYAPASHESRGMSVGEGSPRIALQTMIIRVQRGAISQSCRVERHSRVSDFCGTPCISKDFPSQQRERDRPWYFVQPSISGRGRLKLSRVRLSHHHFLVPSKPSTCLGIDQRLFLPFLLFLFFFYLFFLIGGGRWEWLMNID